MSRRSASEQNRTERKSLGLILPRLALVQPHWHHRHAGGAMRGGHTILVSADVLCRSSCVRGRTRQRPTVNAAWKARVTISLSAAAS